MEALGVAVALLVSLILGRLSLSIGPGLGFVDLPDHDLKPHRGRPIALGGFGLFAGLHLGLLAAGLFDWALFAATLVMWLVGLTDDRVGLSPAWRLVAAVFAGGLMAMLRDPFPGVLTLIASIALVAVSVNAVNLLDGLDVLAGSVGATSAVGLAVLAALRGYDEWLVAVILASALIGFLVWNLPPARIYLGDNGAYVVGVVLAWIALTVSPDLESGLVAIAVIGVPILDLGATVVRRVAFHRPLLAGDREHTYDQLHAVGMGVIGIATVFCATQVIWATSVIAVAELTDETIAVFYAIGMGIIVVGWLVWRPPWREDPPSRASDDPTPASR